MSRLSIGAIAGVGGLGLWMLLREQRMNAALAQQADWLHLLANEYLLDLGNLAYEHVENGADNLKEQSLLLDKILITIERANMARVAAESQRWTTR